MDDLISRQAAIDALDKRFDDVPMELTVEILQLRKDLRERIPSAQPYTDDEIQTMQDLEQAELDKAYQLGYEEGKKDAFDEVGEGLGY
jgi:hypothetical protein